MKLPAILFAILCCVSVCFPQAPPAGTNQVLWYDAINGLDSNPGTSNAPKQHFVYSSLYTGTFTAHASDQHIFRGGAGEYYGTMNTQTISVGGTALSPVYIGADSNWFVGSQWQRPGISGLGSADSLLYCTASHINFNSLDMSNICCRANFGSGIVAGGNVAYITETNCWNHNWMLTNTVTTDDAHGGFIFQLNGGYGQTNLSLYYCKVSNSEHPTNGVCVREADTLYDCEICSNSSGILFRHDVNGCLVHDICYPIPSFDPTYHENLDYMDLANGNVGPQPPGTINCYARNSHYYNWGLGASGVYPNPVTQDCYVYNCIIDGMQSSQMAVEVECYTPSGGTVYSFYGYFNTISNYNSGAPGFHIVNRSPVNKLNNLVLSNNVVIGSGAFLTDASTGEYVTYLNGANYISQTVAGAGLNASYQPQSGSPLIGAAGGISIVPTDYYGNSRIPPDIGAIQHQFVGINVTGGGQLNIVGGGNLNWTH